MKTYQKNQPINNLIFLEEVGAYVSPHGVKARRAKFKCHCGSEFITTINKVKSGHTKSCGCTYKKRDRENNHIYTTHPLYAVWYAMKNRCFNRANHNYKNYGDRGISVCKEWSENFESFYNWAIDNGYKDNLQLDRANNNGDYDPNNCRFITQTENSHNKRTNVLDWNLVNEIRRIKLLFPLLTTHEFATAYNISTTTARNVLNNATWNNI